MSNKAYHLDWCVLIGHNYIMLNVTIKKINTEWNKIQSPGFFHSDMFLKLKQCVNTFWSQWFPVLGEHWGCFAWNY